MEPYTRSNRSYFPDFCDQLEYGVNTIGSPYVVSTPLIVNNPLLWTNSLDGYKNPAWRTLVNTNKDATTPMTASRISIKANYLDVSISTSDVSGFPQNYAVTEWKGYPIYSLPNSLTPPQDVLDRVRNRAIRTFIQRANQARSTILGGQDLGEWKETVRAVTNPLGTLKRFILDHVAVSKKRLRRIKRSGSTSFQKVLADTYLEFTFGWNPLASDIGQAVGALRTRYNNPDKVNISANASESFSSSNTMATLFQSNYIRAVQSVLSYGTVQHRLKGCVLTDVTDGTRSVQQVLGLLPENFVPTVWELIPYSFVVDYFVNIGDIVNAYAFRRSNLSWGVETKRTLSIKKYGSVSTYNNAPIPDYYPKIRRLNYVRASGGDATLERKTVTRSPIAYVSLIPTVEFSLPVSSKPWVNIGAILLSHLRSR